MLRCVVSLLIDRVLCVLVSILSIWMLWLSVCEVGEFVVLVLGMVVFFVVVDRVY